MKKLFLSSLILLSVNTLVFAQISNPDEVIAVFCDSFAEGVNRTSIVEDNTILDDYRIIDVATGDVFYNLMDDVAAVIEQISSGERFMVCFKAMDEELLVPHSFEFTKIPCDVCGGMLGGFDDIIYDDYSFAVSIMVGSRGGSDTRLTYQYIKETDEIALIQYEYEEFDRATGDVFNKISKDYMNGEQIRDGVKSTIDTNELETFTNCMVYDSRSDGPQLFVFGNSLPMYMKSNGEYEELLSVSFGETVTLLEPVNDDAWIVAEYGHMAGYMDADYLLPMPTPMQDRTGIELYMRNIPEISLIHELQDEHGFTYEKAWQHEYGLTYIERFFKMSDDYTVMEQHLKVDDISLFQGWLLARALLNELEREVPTIGENEIMDDNYYQLISVKKVDGGVEIFFPERAD